jgi:hypothetical protein
MIKYDIKYGASAVRVAKTLISWHIYNRGPFLDLHKSYILLLLAKLMIVSKINFHPNILK